MDSTTHQIAENWLSFEQALDASSVLEVQAEAELALRRGMDLVVDLGKVDFLDPSGVGLLVFLFKRQRAAGRQFQIVGVQGQPAVLLRKLRLERSLGISFNDNARNAAGQLLALQAAS